MSDQRLSLPEPVTPGPPPRPAVRLEYLGFRDVEAHREYRFRVYGPAGAKEFRSRIAKAAFDARLLRVSDGPDLCYAKLARAVADGPGDLAEVVTIDETDLSRYREEHAPVSKRRPPWSPEEPGEPVAETRKRQPQRPAPATREPVPPPAAPPDPNAGPALEPGQRVKHAVFGMGVTTVATPARTVVSFDSSGSRSFVTSLLEIEVLSAAHTWETGPRGVNRPRRTAGEPAGSST